jgi:hypothetical protein
MGEGRSKAAWLHTSSIVAMLAEINRDPKKRSRPYRAADFNPHLQKKEKETPLKTVTMRELHGIMPDLPGQMGDMAARRPDPHSDGKADPRI